MDNVIIYKFESKDELYKSLGPNHIHNATRICLINFYESHLEIEFIKAEIKILHDVANSNIANSNIANSNEEWNVNIKTLFRCFFEGERDKTIVEAHWTKNNFMEPILTPACHPEKDKWYRIPYGILEKINEKDNKLRAVENELKRLNEEKEFIQKDQIEGTECTLL